MKTSLKVSKTREGSIDKYAQTVKLKFTCTDRQILHRRVNKLLNVPRMEDQTFERKLEIIKSEILGHVNLPKLCIQDPLSKHMHLQTNLII